MRTLLAHVMTEMPVPSMMSARMEAAKAVFYFHAMTETHARMKCVRAEIVCLRPTALPAMMAMPARRVTFAKTADVSPKAHWPAMMETRAPTTDATLKLGAYTRITKPHALMEMHVRSETVVSTVIAKPEKWRWPVQTEIHAPVTAVMALLDVCSKITLLSVTTEASALS